MEIFFSRNIEFLERLYDAHFPVFLVPMFLFLIFKRRRIVDFLRENSAARFLLLYLFVVVFLRYVLLIVGYPYQRRYFYPILFLSIFPVSAGILLIGDFLSKYKFKLAHAAIVFIFILLAAGKALNPPRGKLWLREIPEMIKKNRNPGSELILITAVDDVRIPYYAGVKVFYMLMPPKMCNIDDISKEVSQAESEYAIHSHKSYKGQMKWLPESDFGRGFNAVFKFVEENSSNDVFILFDYPAEALQKYFEEKSYNPNIELVCEFRIDKTKKVSLYKGKKKSKAREQ